MASDRRERSLSRRTTFPRPKTAGDQLRAATETFGYKLQVTGGTAAPTNKKYF